MSQNNCDSLQGIGLIKFPKKSTFKIYNEDLSTFLLIEKNEELKCDFIMKDIDSDFFKIICLEETDSTYVVLINEQDNLKKIVRKNQNITFQKMEDFILSASTICNKNCLKDDIDGQSIVIKGDILKPVKIDGDWLKVESTYFDPDKEKEFTNQAWVQWRLNNSIIVTVLYLR